MAEAARLLASRLEAVETQAAQAKNYERAGEASEAARGLRDSAAALDALATKENKCAASKDYIGAAAAATEASAVAAKKLQNGAGGQAGERSVHSAAVITLLRSISIAIYIQYRLEKRGAQAHQTQVLCL